MKDLAASRVRYGYKRICLLLNREGWGVNHKRVYRLYREEGLGIRASETDTSSAPAQANRALPRGPTRDRSVERLNVYVQRAMDFVSERLFDQRPFRILALMDCFSRESLAIEPRVKFRALNVVDVLDDAVAKRGVPKSIRVDNGPEFAGKLLDQWAYHNGVELDFSRPGKPTE